MDIGSDWRGVAGFVIGGFPAHFAGGFVKRDNSRAIASANIEQHRIALNERRTGDPEEAFWRAILFFGIDAPKLLSVREIPTAHHAFGAVSIDASIGYGGRSARALIKTKIIAVMSRIAAVPKRRSFIGVEAL